MAMKIRIIQDATFDVLELVIQRGDKYIKVL